MSPLAYLEPQAGNFATDAERAELDAECIAIAHLLVSADDGLACTALEDAKGAPVRDPGNQGRVDREIGKATRDLEKRGRRGTLASTRTRFATSRTRGDRRCVRIGLRASDTWGVGNLITAVVARGTRLAEGFRRK